ncbi:BTAD domain-containing putative transcriptional regulator [Nocardia sp. NPDC057668]|uniref:BTAD domain-containing putative transcriptional regulator n=1 Tax=Nocardia sp. NPDC057668 TaxID=3346202 RepID=UPI003671F4A5
MTTTRIGVLGPLHISIDGRRVPPGAPMQCAVLGRLVAAGGRVVPTDRLIDDLWSGDPPTKAVAALQVYIHNLRRVFEPDRPRRARSRVIVSESHGYALNLEPDQVDSWHFEQLLHGHESAMRDPAGRPEPLEQIRVLDAALACWHGNAFESFAGTAWAAQEIARLAALRLTAAELRAQAALELNRPAEVVLALRPVFEEHPGREECARLLALAQYRLGQSLDALATVRRSREFLTLEFGVDPGPGLRDLETAILTHSVEAEPSSAAVMARVPDAAAGPEPVPDSGYGEQRAAVLAAASAAAAGEVRLVWLAGEAGAGKTTLAATVLARLAEQSWATVVARCPEVDGAPPAWAWSEVLTGLDAEDPETYTATDAFTLARRVVRSCRERTAHAPVAIVLEDVHGADAATLQVLRQVVNWLRDRPILIVATLRGTEAGPGVRDTAAALALFTAGRVELDGLDLAGTRRAALAAGLTAVDDRTVALLRRRTGGNPLFVRELAKLLVGQGDTDALPGTVRDLLGRRIAQLPAEVVELLRHLSVWGEHSDVRTLAASTGHSADSVIDLIAGAEAARLLRTDRSGRVTFDHALVRETVYYDIPVLRRARMHWAAFDLLRSNPDLPRGGEIDALAHHAALGAGADTAELALEFVRAAARRCGERRMRADAVRRWRSVLALHELAGHNAPQGIRPASAAHQTLADWPALTSRESGSHRATFTDHLTLAELAAEASAAASIERAAAAEITWAAGDTRETDPAGTDAPRVTGPDAPPVGGAADTTVDGPAGHFGPNPSVGTSGAATSESRAGAPEKLVAQRDSDGFESAATSGVDAEPRFGGMRPGGGDGQRPTATGPGNTDVAGPGIVRERPVVGDGEPGDSIFVLADRVAPGDEVRAEDEVARADRVALLRARCELVIALAYDGQHIAARAVREQALELAENLGDTALLAHAATCWPTPLIWSVHDWHTPDPRIRGPLRTAIADTALPVATRVRLQVTTVFELALEDFEASARAAAAATALAEPAGDPELLCTAINAQAFAAFGDGGFLRATELKRHATRLLQVSTAARLTEFRALAHYLLFRAELADANLLAAAEHARSAGEYASDGQLRHLLDALAPFDMMLELLRGDTDEVHYLLAVGFAPAERIVALSEEGAAEPSRDPNTLHIGIAISLAWLADDMSDYVDELRDRVAIKPELFVSGYALALVHAGRDAEARRVLAEAPPLGPQFWSTFSAVRARAAIALGDLDAARVHYDQLLPYAGTIAGLETGAVVLSPIDLVLADLATVLGDPDTAATHRAAADALEKRLQLDLDVLAARASAGRVLVRPRELRTPGPSGHDATTPRPPA